MRKVIVLVPFLLAMTCNPDPRPGIESSEQCVRAMQEFARESKERGKQMAVVANILGRSSLREEEQTRVLKQLAQEMKTWRCTPVELPGLPQTPLPTPLPIPGG